MPGITHKFTSPKPDSSDATKVRATAWNDNHKIEDIETTGGHFFWDNATKLLRLGFAGVYNSIRASIAYIKSSGPDWAALTNCWNAIHLNVGGYPDDEAFGADSVPLVEGFRTSMYIPAEADFGNHSAGISSYVWSNSATCGAVAIYGFACPKRDLMTGSWGANFGVANHEMKSRTDSGGATRQVGYNNTNLYGIEIDVDIAKTFNGIDPRISARGIYAVMSGLSVSTHETVNAFEIDAVQANYWKNGIKSNDGACKDFIIDAGANGIGAGSGSQAIRLSAINASAVRKLFSLFMDPLGNTYFRGSAGSAVYFDDDAGQTHLSYDNSFVRIQRRFQLAQQSTPASATAAGTMGEIRWDSGFMYVCVADNTWKRSPLTTW